MKKNEDPEPFTLELEDGTKLQAVLRVESSSTLIIQTQGLGDYAVKAQSAREFANLVLWLLFDADPKRPA